MIHSPTDDLTRRSLLMHDKTDEAPQETAVTLVDVAVKAGVNKVTASIVLSGGSGNTRVSDATRQRILKVAEELGYQPNAIARSLRRRKTDIIGFYMSGYLDTRDLFLSEISSGLHERCEHHNRDLLVHGRYRGLSADKIFAQLLNGKVDGLVLHVHSDEALIGRLAASRLPVVAIANPVPDLPCVGVDDAEGSRLLVDHLAKQGHRCIHYATSPFKLTSTERRFAAFQAAAAEAGIRLTSSHVGGDEQTLDSLDHAITPVRGERPTAIACWNDSIAYRVVTHLELRGLQVPGDIAVAGFDGYASPIPPAYRLTTVRAPWREVAGIAVDVLAANDGKPNVGEIMLPVSLLTGDTA